MEYTLDSKICYGSDEAARMVMNTLSVDAELNSDKVSRELRVEDGNLHIHFEAAEPRLLRAAVSAFYDLLGLATRTYEAFSQELPPVKADA
mmetsp:Transcript_16157/g.31043  ORF Transcript_16157/g.31043 Transcript_16157/m.31043 type:complete len:91 (-) Transcript_16157:1081-1353(-)